MKRTAWLYQTAALALFFAAAPAYAQFGQTGKPEAEVTGAKTTTSGFVQFLPLARFSGAGGGFNAFSDGVLFAADGAITFKSDDALIFGAWYWMHNTDNIIELHGKYFLPRLPVGLQVSYLNSRGTQDYDFFLLYDITSSRVVRKSLSTFKAMIGLGGYKYQDDGTQFTAYGQLSFRITRAWSVDATYWHIRSPIGFQDRIGIGTGFRF